MTKPELKPAAMYDSVTVQGMTGCGNIYVMCAYKDGHLHHVDIQIAKRGSCANSLNSAVTDALNEVLRLGGNVHNLTNIMEGHSCHRGMCCSNVVADCLKEWDEKYGKVPK